MSKNGEVSRYIRTKVSLPILWKYSASLRKSQVPSSKFYSRAVFLIQERFTKAFILQDELYIVFLSFFEAVFSRADHLLHINAAGLQLGSSSSCSVKSSRLLQSVGVAWIATVYSPFSVANTTDRIHCICLKKWVFFLFQNKWE